MSLVLIATVTASVPLAVFFAQFFRVDWRKNPASKWLMGFAVVCMAIMGLALARAFGYVPPEWARAAVFFGVALIFWWLLITFNRVQRAGRREDEKRLRRQMERDELRR